MNIKKNRRAGVCIAMRCKEPSVEGFEVCERHKSESAGGVKDVEGVVVGDVQVTGVAPIQAAADLDQALHHETTEATEAYALAESFEIKTQDDLVFAAEVIADAKGNYKRLEEQKQQILQPMNESVKRIRELFRPAQEYYSAIEGAIKMKVAAAARVQAENNARALAEAQSEINAGREPTALAQVQHIGNVEGLQVREVWDFEIVDEDKVDRVLMAPALDKIRLFLRECNAAGETPAADGIRFFKKNVVASRAS